MIEGERRVRSGWETDGSGVMRQHGCSHFCLTVIWNDFVGERNRPPENACHNVFDLRTYRLSY